jgi:hypothetical protein
MHKVCHPFQRISHDERLADAEVGPPETHGELERPRIPIFVNDTIDVTVSDIVAFVEVLLHRSKYTVEQPG